MGLGGLLLLTSCCSGLAASHREEAETNCRLAVVVGVGSAEVGLLHATVSALAPVPDDVSVLLVDVAEERKFDAQVGCARTDTDSQCGHALEHRPTIELVARSFQNVEAIATATKEPAAALAAAAIGSGCEHSLFISHNVLLQEGLASFAAKLRDPLGTVLTPLSPTTAIDATTSSLGSSKGPIGVVGAKLLRADGTIAHAGFSFVPTARPFPPPPPSPYASSYGNSYSSSEWSSFDSVDYAPSYRLGSGLGDHTKRTSKNSRFSGYTSWKDAEPLASDDRIGLTPLDDYLLEQDLDTAEQADETDDEDDLRLYGYADAKYASDYNVHVGEDTAGGSLLETLSTGLSDLSVGLGATVAGTEPAKPPKKKMPKSTALPYHRLGGMPGTHPGASGKVPIGVPAVSAQALMVVTATLAEAVAAIESYSNPSLRTTASVIDGSVDWRTWGVELGFVGLCLVLRQAGYAVALQPSAVATLLSTSLSGGGNGGVPAHSAAAATGFRDAFDETVLLPGLTSSYMLQGKVGILYSMECGSPETLGFTMEALGFVLALRHVLPVKLEVREWSTCERNVLAEQPAETHVLASALRRTAFEPGVKLVRLLHHDPGRYSAFGGLTETPRHTVGRSMYETDSVPAHWVELCNDDNLVDEVLPEPVDTALFSPDSAASAVSTAATDVVRLGTQHPIVMLFPELATVVSHKTTVFLSVFKWETRKGWDLLLTAFFAEFGEDDDVLLLLRTSPERNGAALDDFIAAFRCEELTDQPPCRREALVKQRLARAPRDGDGNPLLDTSGRPLYSSYADEADSVEDAPVVDGGLGSVRVIDKLSRSRLPALYGAVDVLVQPSRGEGWGLPMVEAMACGTPVIGTRWSGPAEFLTEDNGYPLRTDGLVPNHEAERAAPDPVDGSERPHYWALPSVAHLRERLRQAKLDGNAGRQTRGLIARKDMVSQYDSAEVAQLFVQRVAHLVQEGKKKADEEIAAAEEQETIRSTQTLVQEDMKVSADFAIRAEDLPLRRHTIQQRKQAQAAASGETSRVTLSGHGGSDRWR